MKVQEFLHCDVFVSSTSVFTSQCHYTSSPYSSSSICCSYQRDKRPKPRNVPESNVLPKIAERWKENTLNFAFMKHVRDWGPSPRQSMTVLWWANLLWAGVCPGYIRFPFSLPFNHSTIGLRIFICKAVLDRRAQGRVCCHLFRRSYGASNDVRQ